MPSYLFKFRLTRELINIQNKHQPQYKLASLNILDQNTVLLNHSNFIKPCQSHLQTLKLILENQLTPHQIISNTQLYRLKIYAT